jgi:hypothetical protein
LGQVFLSMSECPWSTRTQNNLKLTVCISLQHCSHGMLGSLEVTTTSWLSLCSHGNASSSVPTWSVFTSSEDLHIKHLAAFPLGYSTGDTVHALLLSYTTCPHQENGHKTCIVATWKFSGLWSNTRNMLTGLAVIVSNQLLSIISKVKINLSYTDV